MAVDCFLKIQGIDGESEDSKHKNEIEIEGFEWSEIQSGTFSQGGGGGAGKVQMRDFKFYTRTNMSSPKLLLACATGQHIPSAVLTVRKAGGGQQDFYMITMSNVLVSSYETTRRAGNFTMDDDTSTNSSTGDLVPMDLVALNFSKIEVEYRPQNSDGSVGNPVKVGYDLKANKSV